MPKSSGRLTVVFRKTVVRIWYTYLNQQKHLTSVPGLEFLLPTFTESQTHIPILDLGIRMN